MIEHNQQIKEIIQRLWAGDTTEAKRLIAVESANLEPQVAELKDKLANMESDLATLNALNPSTGEQLSFDEAGLGATQKAEPKRLNPTQKRHREREILNAADEILQDKSEFTSDAIAEILLKSGIAIGVPENRITTAIGGVLKKHQDKYERIGSGVYKKISHSLLEQGGNGEAIRT